MCGGNVLGNVLKLTVQGVCEGFRGGLSYKCQIHIPLAPQVSGLIGSGVIVHSTTGMDQLWSSALDLKSPSISGGGE